MTATNQDVEDWKQCAKEKKAKYLIVICDLFSFDNYPIYANTLEELYKIEKEKLTTNMEKIEEVIEI